MLFLDRMRSAHFVSSTFTLALLILLGTITTPAQAQRIAAKNRAVRGPYIVAHRGLLRHAPENTLANFRACLELRLGFEFDVERTKDGHLICMHDATLDRTTNGSGRVADRTLEEIQKLDAGSWFSSEFQGEKAPTVDAVMRLISQYNQHDVLIAVDIKAAGVEPQLVRLAEKHNVLGKLLFIGRTIGDRRVRSQLKATSSDAQAAVVANNASEFQASLEASTGDWVYVRYIPAAKSLRRVAGRGKKSFIAGSTVSGPNVENWREAAAHCIDAILTDYPLQLRAALHKE